MKIELRGNTFTNFYKYPDPDYVLSHNSSEESQIENQPNYDSQMYKLADTTKNMIRKDYAQCDGYSDDILEFKTVRDGSFRQEKLHTCFRNCKNYNYDEYKEIFTIDTRKNCSDADQQGL